MSISRRNFIKGSLAAGLAVGASALPIKAFASNNGKKKKFKPAKRVIIFTFDGIRVDGFKTAKPVSLPHCIDEGEIGFNASGCVNRQQLAWYRKRFEWKRTRAHAFLHFEAVMGKCEIDGYLQNAYR